MIEPIIGRCLPDLPHEEPLDLDLWTLPFRVDIFECIECEGSGRTSRLVPKRNGTYRSVMLPCVCCNATGLVFDFDHGRLSSEQREFLQVVRSNQNQESTDEDITD